MCGFRSPFLIHTVPRHFGFKSNSLEKRPSPPPLGPPLSAPPPVGFRGPIFGSPPQVCHGVGDERRQGVVPGSRLRFLGPQPRGPAALPPPRHRPGPRAEGSETGLFLKGEGPPYPGGGGGTGPATSWKPVSSLFPSQQSFGPRRPPPPGGSLGKALIEESGGGMHKNEPGGGGLWATVFLAESDLPLPQLLAQGRDGLIQVRETENPPPSQSHHPRHSAFPLPSRACPRSPAVREPPVLPLPRGVARGRRLHRREPGGPDPRVRTPPLPPPRGGGGQA